MEILKKYGKVQAFCCETKMKKSMGLNLLGKQCNCLAQSRIEDTLKLIKFTEDMQKKAMEVYD